MLRGAPNAPAYTRSVVPSQVNRLAISDLAYSDFAGQGIFYLAQTDWSGGIKTESIWRDDAKYYYSSNIDAFSRPGEISVTKSLTLNNSFGGIVTCGVSAKVAGSNNQYVGTVKISSHLRVYKYDGASWSDVAGTTFGANNANAAAIFGHKDRIFVSNVGTSNDLVVNDYNGSSWTNHSPAINIAMGWDATNSRAACESAGKIYVGLDATTQCGIVSSDNLGVTWTKEVDLGYGAKIIAMATFFDKIYYLVYSLTGDYAELRVFNPVDSTDASVIFFAGSFQSYGVNGKILRVFNGKLVISIHNKIYEFDGNDFSKIFENDSKKVAIGLEASANLDFGCVEKGERLYWGNLVYDGSSFFNFKKVYDDGTGGTLLPIFCDASDRLWYYSDLSASDVYIDASTYKETTAKNFIVISEMSPVVSIDKLLHSATLIFEKLVANDEIKIEYSIDNRSSWTTAANLTYASEGGSIIKREIIIPGSVIFNKIWWRISMANTGGSTTPTILDFIMAYRPIPNYKNRWQMRLNMSDGIKLLNKQNDDREGDDMNSQLWNEKLAKRHVKFQDIDYVECTLRTSMTKTQTSALISAVKKLPMQGRIRAVSGSVAEEMYYTSAKSDRILGINRGVRGTTARAYLSGQVLDNGYDAFVDDITTNLSFTDEKKTESIAQVLLIES